MRVVRVTPADLRHEHNNLSTAALAAINRAAAPAPHVDAAMLMALASRETNMRNVVGDSGHGRGMWQADDRWQEVWLKTHRGCKSGTSIPIYRDAWAKGRVLTISDGAKFATLTLEANVSACIRENVRNGDRMFVAVAAWNMGLHGALVAYKRGGRSAVDAGTTHKDYATDVFERLVYLRRIMAG